MKDPVHVEIRPDDARFSGFFGTWVYPGEITVLVDTGPAATGSEHARAVRSMGVERADFILLTHIHLDHAGGLAAFLEEFPEARAVCHANGVRHMIDPGRLWEGSLKVLGELAEMYGRPGPVAEERLVPHDRVGLDGLTVVETPGHAPHHLAYSWRGRLFSGEAGGNMIRVNGREYLRPATPPRFFLEEALGSVDRMLALPDQPIHYGHFDQAGSSRVMLGRFRRQLTRWRDIMAAEVKAPGVPDLIEHCIDALLEKDPELAAFADMQPAVQDRERYFMRNSVRGYLGYLGVDTPG